VSITSPTNNQSIGGTTTITASASDNTTVKQVEFFDGTTSLGVDTTAPYSANFSTVGFPNGSTHSLKAVATDTATTPNSTTSSVVTVTINNACQMPAATYGVTTVTVTVPSPGTYTVWSLMRAPDSANNAYYFNADLGGGQSICPMVIGDGALTANQWAWVNYKNGSTSDKATITFTTAGTHTVTLTGKEQGVALDRIMLLSDACVPTNLGNNCIQSTTPPPTPSPTPTPPPPAPNPTPAPKAGDVNGNGTIDLTDFFIMRTNFGQSGRTRAQGDLTGDGMVTLADFFILRQNFGK